MKNTLTILLVVLAGGQVNGQKSTHKSTDQQSREIVYQKLVELDQWYQEFADTIYFSESNEYSNSSNELITDTTIRLRSIQYFNEEKSKAIFDKQALKKWKEFIQNKNSTASYEILIFFYFLIFCGKERNTKLFLSHFISSPYYSSLILVLFSLFIIY